ncbi:hypothetical protein RUM43_001667 [Polyplax serrata]|uniref:G-protein coupled receptors family 1 profile domain-containing protein n=1 Tax=Polyplax serrata TaxID=468196 RepID=A0AAN8SEP4_POLSC
MIDSLIRMIHNQSQCIDQWLRGCASILDIQNECVLNRIFLSSELRMRKHTVGQFGVASTGVHHINIRKEETKLLKARRNEWRITQMVLVIFLSYLACYLPITIVKVADKDVKYPGLHVMGYILLYFSSCVNPIIYVIMNSQYRQAYKTVLFCKKVRVRSHHNHSSFADKSKEGSNRTIVTQSPIILNNMRK